LSTPDTAAAAAAVDGALVAAASFAPAWAVTANSPAIRVLHRVRFM